MNLHIRIDDLSDPRIAEFLEEHLRDMRRISPLMVHAFKNRILNVHPALLPAFPGVDSQRQALDHGVKLAGCTVHIVDEQVDHGPIVLQAAVPVEDGDTVETLSARILQQEHRLYPEALALMASGRLTIEGRRVDVTAQALKADDKKDSDRVVYSERAVASFARSLTLPTELDQTASDATLETGVLTLTLAKKLPASRQIQIK